MKKIGIITYHLANNLGAVLQAYALQQTIIKRYNVDCKILNYYNDIFKEKSNCTGIKRLPKNLYYSLKSIRFNKFRNKYLITTKLCTKDSIKKYNKSFDCLITGSDQVWNLSCSREDFTYFLDFCDNIKSKKISYAASVGNYHFTDDDIKKIKPLLEKFDSISIRERDSLEQFKFLNKNIEVVPDPVFLLEKSDWDFICNKKILHEDYVFVYLIQEDVNVLRAATKYAEENNLRIINNKKSIEFIFHNSPADFISWIKYANKIFTNSFHGTAFSLIYNKDFEADIELKNGDKNNRILNLLKIINAEDKIINSTNNNNISSYNLDYLKNTGFNFLDTELK